MPLSLNNAYGAKPNDTSIVNGDVNYYDVNYYDVYYYKVSTGKLAIADDDYTYFYNHLDSITINGTALSGNQKSPAMKTAGLLLCFPILQP